MPAHNAFVLNSLVGKNGKWREVWSTNVSLPRNIYVKSKEEILLEPNTHNHLMTPVAGNLEAMPKTVIKSLKDYLKKGSGALRKEQLSEVT